MRMRLMKRNVIGLAAEVLLAMALIFSMAPTSAQADSQALQADRSAEIATPSNQEAASEQELPALTEEEESGLVLHHFIATGYSIRGTTATGIRVNPGSVAADPTVLPMGSVIRLYAGEYSGIYTVLDTGPRVRGRRLDIWFPTYEEAVEFGVRKVRVEVMRYGWEPAEKEISSL